jgi:HEAT repeat protein
MFRAAFEAGLHAYAANYAVDGIELIGGADEARKLRMTMLDDPRIEMVRATVLSLPDSSYIPALIETLGRRSEDQIRISAIRKLGHLGTTASLPTLRKYLDVPQLRPHVVEALADLNDPGAIRYLQPLLDDTTEAWPQDNHGPMLRVCDLARAAIGRLAPSTGSRGSK